MDPLSLFLSALPFIGLAVLTLIVFAITKEILSWRRVVPVNMVHIIQTGKRTISYGANLPGGNVYYAIPSWIPVIGLTVTALPVNNFDIKLDGYDAYDKNRAPFALDVIGFFRITDTNEAAKRASNFQDLQNQLKLTMQGAARAVLAKFEVDEIMTDRSRFADEFTREVTEGLKSWGVENVRSMELMDIRDYKDSNVIKNIMAKKISEIEKDSRITVANNMRDAETAEIAAKQEIAIRDQAAVQAVGERTAQQEQAVGIALEKSRQEIAQEAAITMTRNMQVTAVETQRTAEIHRDAAIVAAEEQRQVQTIAAEAQRTVDITEAQGQQQQTVLVATGNKDAALLEAEGIRAKGLAEGDAEKAMLMAPVEAQKELAVAVGSNEPYQKYLITVRRIEADEKIGMEQAKAMDGSDIKIIANSDNISGGLDAARALLSSGLGQRLGAVVEGFKNTEIGAKLLDGQTEPAKPNGATN